MDVQNIRQLEDTTRIQDLIALDAGHIPVEHFFLNPEKTSFELSPDGKHIAWLGPFQSRLNVFVQNRKGGEPVRITSETERDIPGFFWKNNQRLVYVNDQGGNEDFHLYAVNLDGSQKTDLTPFPGVKAEIIDHLEDFPDEMIISLNKRNPQLFDAYRINIQTGELALIGENDPAMPITSWMTDHEGKLRLATAITEGVNASLLYRKNEDEPFRVTLTTNFKASLRPLLFTFDNQRIYATSNIGYDREALVEFDPETGREVRLIFEHPEYDTEAVSWSRKRRVLTAIVYTSWKKEREILDEEAGRIVEHLEEALGQYEFGLVSSNTEETLFIVRTMSDRSLGSYYLYDVAENRLEKLADVNPHLKEEEMSHMKPICYQSRDGLTIHGYLTIPHGADPQNLPVVVHPHGGPWWRDKWGFNPLVQLMASRGYAVFQMNFRGSTGYGRKFWESSFRQWGQAMQNDITDGVQWLVEQKIADPKRIAIFGGSYGGYATLAGVTFTPDLYCCAVDYVGVSNLFTFMETIPPYWEPFLSMMYEMVGHPEKDKEMLHRYSPVFHVDKIKVPLFVIQGANDPRVKKAESDQIVAELRKKGQEVVYMVKYNEGHGFQNEENKFEAYRAMAGFFKKHLG